MPILRLKPVAKENIWGGTRLCEEFGIEPPAGSISPETAAAAEDIGQVDDAEESALPKVGEVWMLSCHPDSRGKVIGGQYDGMSLPEVLTSRPDFMGSHAKRFNRFPLLIKLIDAAENLSVQVHPDDEYAADTNDAQGKTELWYVIEAEPDAEIIYGFKNELTQEQFRHAIENDTLLDELEHFKVRAGDVFFIEAGTVHAIGKGVLLAEVQQNSTTEYRIYDYGRVDAEGNPRPLHIDRAIDVAITVPPTFPPGPLGPPVDVDSRTEMVLGECKYFRSVIMDTFMPTHFEVDEDSFASVVVLDGEAKFFTDDENINLRKGDSAFITAGTGRVTVSGRAIFIVTTI